MMFKLVTSSPKSRHYQADVGKALKECGKGAEENDGDEKVTKKRGGVGGKPKRKRRGGQNKGRGGKGKGRGRGGKKRKAEDEADAEDPEEEDDLDGGDEDIKCFASFKIAINP